jgi:hypothetical protein
VKTDIGNQESNSNFEVKENLPKLKGSAAWYLK